MRSQEAVEWWRPKPSWRHDSCSRDPEQEIRHAGLARSAKKAGRHSARQPIRGPRPIRCAPPPTPMPALQTASSAQPLANLLAAAGRAEAHVVTKCLVIYVITLFPVSASSLTRPWRSGVPDRSCDGCFLAKHCVTPGFTDRDPSRCPSHSQNLPSSSEGITAQAAGSPHINTYKTYLG